MTLGELLLIKRRLVRFDKMSEAQHDIFVRPSDCAGCMETKMALDVVEREIKLKTMDPRKP